MPVLAEVEPGVAKSPDVEALRFVRSRRRRCFRCDELGCLCGNQAVILANNAGNVFEVSLNRSRIVDERHYQVIRRDVVEVTRMDQNSVFLQKRGRCFFFIPRDGHRDVEAASWLRIRECLQPFDCGGAALPDPLLVIAQKPGTLSKYPRYGELRDLVNGEKRV